MSTLQLSQVGAAWDALPSTKPIPTGGTEGMVRTFNAAAAAQAVGTPAPDAEPEQTADATAPCPAIGGKCAGHENDHGEIIHRGQAYTNDLADLRAFHLEQWGDDTPRIVSSHGGTWPDLDLEAFDAVIEAAEQQLAHARNVRTHLAAALGEAPPTQPPENQKAQPANGATGTEAQA